MPDMKHPNRSNELMYGEGDPPVRRGTSVWLGNQVEVILDLPYPVEGFLQVELEFGLAEFGGSTSTCMVEAKDLRKWLQAKLELHFFPGVNPYSQRTASSVTKITVTSMVGSEDWTATPGFGIGRRVKGIKTWRWGMSYVIWERPPGLWGKT